jgi:hypothetical protein
MGFLDECRQFGKDVDTADAEATETFAKAAFTSIVHGSAATGAPGQPVARVHGGKLRDSWRHERPSAIEHSISTDLDYAPDLEEGVGPNGQIDLTGPSGGFHSLSLTEQNADRLLEPAVERAAAGKDL